MLQLCSLASGSSGNATLIASPTTSILVDAGTPARTIVERLAELGRSPADLDGILITHAHGDHYRAAGTLHSQFEVPIYVDRSVARALRHRARRNSWRRVKESHPLPERVGDLEIETLETSHGLPLIDGRTVGFRVARGGRSVTVLTDLGTFDPSHVEAVRNSDAVLIEANYDEGRLRRKLSDLRFSVQWKYLETVRGDRGHLSNDQCSELLLAGLTGPTVPVLLGHLSENHDRPGFDNNDFATASNTVRERFRRAGMTPPRIERTYRSGRRDPGRSSSMIELD